VAPLAIVEILPFRGAGQQFHGLILAALRP